MHGLPGPEGTGFFVSPDGWFITAAHVVCPGEWPASLRGDLDQMYFGRPRTKTEEAALVDGARVVEIDITNDFALVKVDWARHQG